jgi:TM2 domain-containing membrane protein YozV
MEVMSSLLGCRMLVLLARNQRRRHAVVSALALFLEAGFPGLRRFVLGWLRRGMVGC